MRERTYWILISITILIGFVFSPVAGLVCTIAVAGLHIFLHFFGDERGD